MIADFTVQEIVKYVKFIVECYDNDTIDEVLPKHKTHRELNGIYLASPNGDSTILREHVSSCGVAASNKELYNVRYGRKMQYEIEYTEYENYDSKSTVMNTLDCTDLSEERLFQLSCTDFSSTVLLGLEFVSELRKVGINRNIVLYYENLMNLLEYYSKDLDEAMNANN